MKNNLIIYVSSHNNYDMLEGEVLKNINREEFEFINVDDKSCDEEIAKGKAICEKHDILFLENKSRGVQMATQTLIDFINENRPDCKWIFCFQHDNYPISLNFFSQISEYIEKDKLDNFGILGFNQVDHGKYTFDGVHDGYSRFMMGDKPLGMMGLAHLSAHDRDNRWLGPRRASYLLSNPEWKTPYIIEFPMWPSVGINIDLWNKVISPTTDYQFHLWLPDIAMQFNYHNYPCLVLPHLYCLNNQDLKEKYNIAHSSAWGSKQGNEYHFGEYSNFKAWKERWGWHYEEVVEDFEQVKENYKNTLIWDYFHHDLSNGPLNNIDLN